MRISTKLVIFLLLLDGAAFGMVASGVAADWGVHPQPGGDEQIEKTNQSASQLEAGGGLASTLFTMYTTLADTLNTIYKLAFLGPDMLNNLGVPWFITDMFKGVITVIVGLDIYYALTGRDV